MKTKLNGFLTLLFALLVQMTFAQERTVSGVVSDNNGLTLPGVNVKVKGTKTGVQTDIDGKFAIKATPAQSLVFSFIGMKDQEVSAASSNLSVKMQSNATELEGVVVTALGIKREKKSLGYASQEVKGSDLNGGTADGNVANLLSGKAAGVEIRRNNNFGGSTNVVIRGNKSLTGNNQALWVVDGMPIDNSNLNFSSQQQGGSGYDYGNNASDINQEDIESINVLKGAAASALYGSRAANGVVIVTTKKGRKMKDNGIGVNFSSGFSIGSVDKSTFVKYQNKYGAGYGMGSSFLGTGTPDTVDTSNDASNGDPFDGSLVYQWNAFTPYSSHFGQATPWTAAQNGPITFFKNSMTNNNTVSIESATDRSNLFASFSNLNQTGIMPNSSLRKNQVSAKFFQKITDKLSFNGYGSVSMQGTVGRNSTGYNDNIVTSFRQWWETNVDVKELYDVYNASGGQNVTWNWADPTTPSGLVPIYWDNPYFTRFQNFSSDDRNRFMGYTSLDYELRPWLKLTGKLSLDTYHGVQEERRAVGSVASGFGLSPVDEASGYQKYDLNYKEINYDFMMTFNKKLGTDLNFNGILGSNFRRQNVDNVLASTIGGLVQPGYYALSNSRLELPFPVETKYTKGVDGLYAQGTLGYKDTYFMDASVRRDVSSTLPKGNNSYVYPAVSGAVVFSNLIKQNWLSFGKIRLNYAEVGNDAAPLSLINTFQRNMNFHGQPIYTLPNTNKNPNLKPERTKSIEAGLEMSTFNKRLGFDVSVYQTHSIDQIVSGAVSSASMVTNAVVNGGDILNKGIELQLTGTPLKSENFRWDVIVNWSKNRSEVISLPGGLTNLQLGSFQGGVTINATPGQPYGTIQGSDYTYVNGQPLVNTAPRAITGSNPTGAPTGYYVINSSSSNIIGNITPDWVGGIRNKFTYKSVSLGFLIDMQKGGDIFSLDQYYGQATGLYASTTNNNDLGNPDRNPIVYNNPTIGLASGYAPTSGGIILPGVKADGSPNDVRTYNPGGFGSMYGYARNPAKAFIYDASYVKLREVSISYNIPQKFLKNSFIREMRFSLVGTNLWIIHKNLPYADPESGLTSGNLSRGYSVGSLPTTRDIGFNMNFKF